MTAKAAMITTLNEDLDNVKIPNILIGFKISKPQLAEQQIQRLELLLTRSFAYAPPFWNDLQAE